MLTNLRKSLPACLICLLLAACQPTRHVPAGQHLLKKDPELRAGKGLPVSELENAIQLEANRKIVVSRVYLGFYNIGTSIQKDSSWVTRLLVKWKPMASTREAVVKALTQSIGEAPALVDPDLINADSTALRAVCLSHGFFHPEITIEKDTLRTLFGRDKKKAKVSYRVEPGLRYLIRNSELFIGGQPASDSARRVLDWQTSWIKEGESYDQAALIRERGRITDLLRNKGYFTAAPQLINFFVDTLTNATGDAAAGSGDIRYLKVSTLIDSLPKQFVISEVEVTIRPDASRSSVEYERTARIRPDRISKEARHNLGLNWRTLPDSLHLTLIVSEELIPQINIPFIAARIHLEEDSLYNQELARLTQQRLQELGMFRYAVLKFSLDEVKGTMTVSVELQMAPHYQLKAGMESFYNGFASTGNNLPSVGGNLSFRNRNAFGQSELLTAGLGGAIGFYSAETDGSAFQSLFYGLSTQAGLNVPGLVLPFAFRRDLSRLSPSTLMSADVVLDQRREFRRIKFGARTTYRLNHIPLSNLAVSEFSPLLLEYIDTQTDSTFQADIVDKLPPAIRRDFERRVSSRFLYTFTYQDYRSTRARPTSWSRFSFEVGGNLPYLLDNLSFIRSGTPDTSTQDQLLVGRLFYGQYLKASAEIKYNIPFRNKSDMVFRVFLGGAVPFNGSPTVPRESRFFSGGPSSMRGWRSNTLGPGTLLLEDLADENDAFAGNGLSLIAPGGEWMFEANAEYRFDLLPPYFELGLFTDIGNVWFHNSSATRAQLGDAAVISPENLRLGWDAGLGFRFDFEFVIFRVDFGQQLYAPDIGWVISSQGIQRFPEPSIAVDYPF